MDHPATNLIYCDRCADATVSKDDCVTALQWPGLSGAYHLRCHGERARGGNPARTPLNSQAVIGLMIIFGLVCLGIFVLYPFPGMDYFSVGDPGFAILIVAND